MNRRNYTLHFALAAALVALAAAAGRIERWEGKQEAEVKREVAVVPPASVAVPVRAGVAEDEEGEAEVLVGGPSCQTFSTQGRRFRWADPNDERTRLWYHEYRLS